MNKKAVWWQVELVLNKGNKKKKTIYLVFDAAEKWADIILDVLVLGFEKKGFTVGGGMERLPDE